MTFYLTELDLGTTTIKSTVTFWKVANDQSHLHIIVYESEQTKKKNLYLCLSNEKQEKIMILHSSFGEAHKEIIYLFLPALHYWGYEVHIPI